MGNRCLVVRKGNHVHDRAVAVHGRSLSGCAFVRSLPRSPPFFSHGPAAVHHCLTSRGDSENGKRRETRGRTEEWNRREGHTDKEVCGWVGGFKVGKVRREKGVYECEVKVHQQGSPSVRGKSETCPVLF